MDILEYYGIVEESLPHQQMKHSVDFSVFCYQLFSREVLDSKTCLSASSSLWLQCDYEEAWNENQEGSYVELVKTLQGCIRIPCAMTLLSILCCNTTVFYFPTQIAIKLLCVQIHSVNLWFVVFKYLMLIAKKRSIRLKTCCWCLHRSLNCFQFLRFKRV